MPSTTSLLSQLVCDFPDITFSPSDTFLWSPEEKTIFYKNETDTVSLLHEVAHASLGHQTYKFDIELIKMEREAWEYVSTHLAKRYKVTIDNDDIEAMLDTYRDWLHSRSLCPTCDATGVQLAASRYSCLACTGSWRVNEARACALRRYKLPITVKT